MVSYSVMNVVMLLFLMVDGMLRFCRLNIGLESEIVVLVVLLVVMGFVVRDVSAVGEVSVVQIKLVIVITVVSVMVAFGVSFSVVMMFGLMGVVVVSIVVRGRMGVNVVVSVFVVNGRMGVNVGNIFVVDGGMSVNDVLSMMMVLGYIDVLSMMMILLRVVVVGRGDSDDCGESEGFHYFFD